LDVFSLTLVGKDVNTALSNLDVAIASLNFLQFVLIKGKLTNQKSEKTGGPGDPTKIWEEVNINKLKEAIFAPWNKLITLTIDKEHADVKSEEKSQQTLAEIKKSGLPALDQQQLNLAQWSNINQMMIIKNILERIDEIVEKGIM
jgi:hypothetical protein